MMVDLARLESSDACLDETGQQLALSLESSLRGFLCLRGCSTS